MRAKMRHRRLTINYCERDWLVSLAGTVSAGRIYGDDILGLQALVTHHDSEFHALAFHENAVALAANCAKVHEYIVTAIPGNKAESLRCVEPLHGARFAPGCRQGARFLVRGFYLCRAFLRRGKVEQDGNQGEQEAGEGGRLACDLRKGGEQDGCLQGNGDQ